MSKTLVVSNEVYERLARGAADRGMTVNSFLKVFSEVVVPRVPSSTEDRVRGEEIERLFAKYRDAKLSQRELKKLDRLIDEEYQVAIQRADQLIAAKTARTRKRNGATPRRSQ